MVTSVTKSTSSVEAFGTGTTIDRRYKVDRLDAQAPTGPILLATQLAMDRQVTVEILQGVGADPDKLGRFNLGLREASHLEHPGAAVVLDFGADEPTGAAFVVYECLRGRSLRQILENNGAIDQLRATRLLVQVASAVAAAHMRGVVHGRLAAERVHVLEAPGGG